MAGLEEIRLPPVVVLSGKMPTMAILAFSCWAQMELKEKSVDLLNICVLGWGGVEAS